MQRIQGDVRPLGYLFSPLNVCMSAHAHVPPSSPVEELSNGVSSRQHLVLPKMTSEIESDSSLGFFQVLILFTVTN